jgi:hypothetical protein
MPPELAIQGSNAGLQAGLYMYPTKDLVVVILSNAWGVGSNSGELVIGLPRKLAALCLNVTP